MGRGTTRSIERFPQGPKSYFPSRTRSCRLKNNLIRYNMHVNCTTYSLKLTHEIKTHIETCAVIIFIYFRVMDSSKCDVGCNGKSYVERTFLYFDNIKLAAEQYCFMILQVYPMIRTSWSLAVGGGA